MTVAVPSVDLEPGEVVALRDLARSLALEAGALVTRERPARVTVAGTKSSPTDVVTAMDTAAEALLRERLAEHRPHDGVLGEERGTTAGSTGLTWVLDPIDGTVNYLYGIPAFAVSVAVVVGDPSVDDAWTSVAGCVHSPASQETWTAGVGLGSTIADAAGESALRVPPPPVLGQALVGTGFGYRPERRARQGRVVADLLPRVRDIRRIGCASIDLCLVASGRLDLYYERGLNPWDRAAAQLVLTQAGGVVRGLGTHPAGADMLVAGADPLAGELAALLDDLGAAQD